MKTNIVVDLKWYTVRQNNSGGSFTVDNDVAHFVSVQAASDKEAENKMNDITASSGYDWCECCGERWYVYFDESDGYEVPTYYGKPLSEHKSSWCNDEIRLHYYNGIVESIVVEREQS